ncbi:MAG TPA: DM13 domain-containing protein [Actinomycetes bacterium]|nr:DM13 domain-containing protein [Actinomycetes bacterium]
MRTRTWLMWVSVPVVAVVVALGVWVSGALVTNDEVLAKGLTALWLIVAGLGAMFVAWRWRQLAVPVVGTYVVVAAGLGGFLLVTSTADRVVDETVVVADVLPTRTPTRMHEQSERSASNNEVARGTFVDGEHATSGVATIIETADGSRVLTLTDFATSPGPDVRVFLAPDGGQAVDGGVDLGGLKGNRGDQQYVVPDGAPLGRVVIWCRTFSVTFGLADLRE